MNTTPPPEAGESRDELVTNAWINALQGRPAMLGVNTASRAGTLLRQLVLQAQSDRAQADAAYAQALVDRWAAAGLVGAPRRRLSASRWPGALAVLRGWWAGRTPRGVRVVRGLGGASAALACLALGVWVSTQPPQAEGPAADEDATVVRGAEAAVHLAADNPGALALRVAELLQRGQVPFRRVDLPSGAVQLQAKLPAEALALRQELLALGIAAPTHGRLNLVISKPR